MLRWLTRTLATAAVLAACVGVSATGAFAAPPASTSPPQIEGPPPPPLVTKEQVLELTRAAEQQAKSEDSILAGIGAENLATARRMTRALEKLAVAGYELSGVIDRLTETNRSLIADQARVRFSSAAAGPVTALLLRHRSQLPDEREMKVAIATAASKSAAAEIARLDLSDEIAALRVPVVSAEKLIEGVDSTKATSMEAIVKALESRRNDYLVPLLAIEGQLAEVMSSLEERQTALAAIVSEYRAFVQAQLLWLPSDSPIGTAASAMGWNDSGLLVSSEFWRDVVGGFQVSVQQFPERWLGTLLLLVALVAYRGRMLRRMRARGAEVGTATDRFSYTFECFVFTVLLALPIPAAMLLVGMLLSAVSEPTVAASSLGQSLQALASIMLLVTLVRECTRPDGIGPVHFGWPSNSVRVARSGVAIVGWVVVPLIFVSLLALRANTESTASGVGRLAFIAAMLVLMVVNIRVFKPSTGMLAGMIQQRPNGLVATLRGLWYPVLFGAPLLLAFGAALGYVVTALLLLRNGILTYWVIVGIGLGLSLLERLFQATNDRFAWRRGDDTADHRRQAEQVKRAVRLTTTVLLVAGVLAAWSDVVPSLEFLRSNALWTVGGADGTAVREVTLRDLLVFGIVLVLTVQLVRDLPGVLGMALLQRFPLDASAKYAIVALGRYVLVLAGIVTALGALKIGWDNVQWLAAAVTVGLGFGLQEIFANFVSGLIMLAERPARIGDIITVDSVTGRVVKIATRATTLVDYDEREIIIPNKQFITTRITNWTLNDTPVRYNVVVGVEYGSDLRLAEELLYEAIRAVPTVLHDPAPMVILRAFGASSIDFDVWYYVSHPQNNLPTRHAAILKVDEIFRARGVVIAFPQMDLHVRSWPAGGPGAGAAAPPNAGAPVSPSAGAGAGPGAAGVPTG